MGRYVSGVLAEVLAFFNLTDRSGKLSITNVAVIVLITKIALADSLDWAVVAGLLVTLLNYGHKRVETNKSVANIKEVVEKLTGQ